MEEKVLTIIYLVASIIKSYRSYKKSHHRSESGRRPYIWNNFCDLNKHLTTARRGWWRAEILIGTTLAVQKIIKGLFNILLIEFRKHA